MAFLKLIRVIISRDISKNLLQLYYLNELKSAIYFEKKNARKLIHFLLFGNKSLYQIHRNTIVRFNEYIIAKRQS